MERARACVLAATDFSIGALNALEEGRWIAWRAAVDLHVLHVAAPGAPWNDHVQGKPVAKGNDPAALTCRTETERRVRRAGKDRGHPSRLPADPPMPDRVDAPMKLVKMARADPEGDSRGGNPDVEQLRPRDDAMLAPRKIRDRMRQWAGLIQPVGRTPPTVEAPRPGSAGTAPAGATPPCRAPVKGARTRTRSASGS